jgi:hypothetical protein
MSEEPKNGMYTRPDGTREWFRDGRHHREDGPAIERPDGARFWCLHGEYHRTDGPACEWLNGARAWWLHGEWFNSAEDHAVAVAKIHAEREEQARVAARLEALATPAARQMKLEEILSKLDHPETG